MGSVLMAGVVPSYSDARMTQRAVERFTDFHLGPSVEEEAVVLVARDTLQVNGFIYDMQMG